MDTLKKLLPITLIENLLQFETKHHKVSLKYFALQIKNQKISNKQRKPIPKCGLSEIPQLRQSINRVCGDYQISEPQSFVHTLQLGKKDKYLIDELSTVVSEYISFDENLSSLYDYSILELQ